MRLSLRHLSQTVTPPEYGLQNERGGKEKLEVDEKGGVGFVECGQETRAQQLMPSYRV